MSDSNTRDEMIIRMNQAMLESVCTGNWAEYSQYCHSDLTCFEAETNGVLAEGLPFHQFYFEPPNEASTANPRGNDNDNDAKTETDRNERKYEG